MQLTSPMLTILHTRAYHYQHHLLNYCKYLDYDVACIIQESLLTIPPGPLNLCFFSKRVLEVSTTSTNMKTQNYPCKHCNTEQSRPMIQNLANMQNNTYHTIAMVLYANEKKLD